MKTIVNKISSLILVTAISIFSLNAQVYSLDKTHASVNFSIKHFFTPTSGNFKKFDGDFTFNPEDLANSSINFTVEVNSVDTDNDKRDAHLLSGDFFNAEKYPNMTFASTSFTKQSDNNYLVKGNLTIKDVTVEVEIPLVITGKVDNPWDESSVILGSSINTTIDRTVFGVGTGNWAATTVIGDEVTIIINMEWNGKK